ncbi:class I SAM-dependent methyltransferase [Mangrovicella endophytica]|uniref:class I SAM-dependent methyltransferase n=1 Tax=Mangrovicella endophytica TaxID=2066697 RepID=UPI000C9E0DBA|nr:class I SAM-dependent methyltransferase [Mangrovicella endophytica]
MEDEIAATSSVDEILGKLRALSLDDFGRLMFSLPDPALPKISAKLPAMAPETVQKSWTGASGHELLRQTLAFTKQLETNVVRHRRRPLQDLRVLDFGCGYGRFIRMLYYYTSPSRIWGLDAWDRSLATCYEANVLANLAQSDRVPTSLPVNDVKFDLGFAFSVFTHLSPSTAVSALAAIRKSIEVGGLFIATIRPVEFWPFIDKNRGTTHSERLMAEHRDHGYAYLPHNGPEGETYGDFSTTPAFFDRPGWEVLGYDSTVMDEFQTSVILRAV